MPLESKLEGCSTLEGEEEAQCRSKVNKEILDTLYSKHGDNIFGCDREEAKEKNIGNFILRTLERSGNSLSEVKDVDEPVCRRGANVIPIELDTGDKIFFKTAGTKSELDPETVAMNQQADNVARFFGEETPLTINFDPEHNITAMSGLEGKHLLTPGEVESAPASEIAEAIMLETIIRNEDRFGNIIAEDVDEDNKKDLIKHIDFDRSDKDLVLRSSLSGTPQKIWDMVERGEINKIERKYPSLREEMRKNLNRFWENEEGIIDVAPEFFNEGGRKTIEKWMMNWENNLNLQLSEEAKEAKEWKHMLEGK